MLIPIQCIDSFNPHVLFIINAVTNKDNLYPTTYHDHDFVELSIVTSGQVNYLIEDKKYVLKKDDVMVFNPGVHHQALLDANTTCTELHIGIGNLHIDCTSPNYMKSLNWPPIVSIQKYKNEFMECCNEIEQEQRLRPLGHSFVLKALVMKLILIIYREMDECSSPTSLQASQFANRDKKVIVQSLIDYMRSYYMEDISLDNISKNMYLSPVYISKIFKEETGTSPINYLIQIRLEKAKEILEKHDMPINLVAKSVGYDDAYYFSKLFKKYYGSAPSAYIKQKRNQIRE
ncbi:AraC family transcriptional regulator [Niameybacter massiliensis]|uniref:AraC family transcriptional regulator n=1 Tax=Holtiella tumoricola TaxID=3018743 RepID=A0AA42DRA4_9FIRM|nr:AraC family transcriptional regulator [Holtiella tumoricola]MDA3733254.1 AraC family transcriptional regulator [Holtiella tumoricola]